MDTARTTTERRLSAGRLKCLQALAFGKLRLGAPAKSELVEKTCPGKRSFHELTNAEADALIDTMKVMAGQTPTRPARRAAVRRAVASGDVATLVTPAQRERLAELTRALIAEGILANYLAGVRLRACGQPDPRTSFEAEKAIEALKAMHERVEAGWRPQEPA